MTTYTFHHDDGHGWLEVPYQDMLNVGVTHEGNHGADRLRGTDGPDHHSHACHA
jgi:hypothetical protein